ncbi:hypothetical protein ABZ401_33155, partial [Streptomyces sp. NPDC005892]|uniref:hypothetical protein n=1 Tax=Streptomyces sp. NPDC005892 TaxID=3155593 RepID=UPI0033F0B31E
MFVVGRLRADALIAYGDPVAPTGRRQPDVARPLQPLVVLERAHVHDAALSGLSRLGLARLPGALLFSECDFPEEYRQTAAAPHPVNRERDAILSSTRLTRAPLPSRPAARPGGSGE